MSIILLLVLVTIFLFLLMNKGNVREIKEVNKINNKVLKSKRELPQSSIYFPVNKIYGWMITDEELFTNPFIDIPLPLPNFKTLEDGIQVFDKYSYDCDCFLKGKFRTNIVDEYVEADQMVIAVVKQIINDSTTLREIIYEHDEFTKLKENTYRLSCSINGEMRKFILKFTDITDKKLEPYQKAKRNIGYFSNQILDKNKTIDIIQRYRRKDIEWYLHPSVKTEWIEPIKQSFKHWNSILLPLGYNLKLNEYKYSGDFHDDEVNIIAAAPVNSYKGVGTSVYDTRDGTILYSRIILSSTVIDESFDLFPLTQEQKDTFMKFIVIHEIGHTLGLRHNFVASVDNNSSYMDYYPLWYPNKVTGELEFFPVISDFSYDKLAIEYGYGEVKDNSTKLFQTDENVDNDLIFPDAQRSTIGCGLHDLENWMRSWSVYRKKLFLPGNDFVEDNKKVIFFLKNLNEAALRTSSFIEGFKLDIRREKMVRIKYTRYVIKHLVDYLIGDTWKLDDLNPYLTGIVIGEDGEVLIKDRPYSGSYSINKITTEQFYYSCVGRLLSNIFSPEKVNNYSFPQDVIIKLLTMSGFENEIPLIKGSSRLHFNSVNIFVNVIQELMESYSPYTKNKVEETLGKIIPLRRRSFNADTKVEIRKERKIKGCGCD